MTWSLILGLLALPGAMGAEDPGRWPVAGEVMLPAGDLVRIDLDGTWVSRCPDPSTYLLLDSQERALPFAWVTSDDAPPARTEPLLWEPEAQAIGWTYRIQPPHRQVPVKALRIRRLPEGLVARVRLEGAPEPVLVWNLPGTGAGQKLDIELPAPLARGPWKLEVLQVAGQAVWWARPGWLDFDAVFDDPRSVWPVEVPLVLGDSIPSGATTSDLAVTLPRAGLPVRDLALAVASEPSATSRPGAPSLFSRPVQVVDSSDPGQERVLAGTTLQRITNGDLPVESTTVALSSTGTAPESLLLRFEDGRSEPLPVTSVTAHLRGAALLVPAPGAGKARILGCGASKGAYDIQSLKEELERWEGVRTAPGEPAPNPGWSIQASTGSVGAPGAPVDLEGFRFSFPLTAPAGLVRLDLPSGVLARGRSALEDLRVVDGQDRQVPFLVERRRAGRFLPGVAESRQEDGSVTRIHLTLPLGTDGTDPGSLPLTALVLRTERGTFRRQVRVAEGTRGERILASASWEETEEGPSRLVLPLGVRVGPDLVVQVENGDNVPLPLDPVRVVVPTASLRFVHPGEGPLRLLLGHETLAAPAYDLDFLRQAVLGGASSPASLGEASVLKVSPKVSNRWVLLGAVGLFSVALLVLIVRLLGREQGA